MMINLASWLLATSIFTQVKSSSLKSCPDTYYLNKDNECIRCTICSRKQEQIQACAALSDTICLCPSKTFHHYGTVACMNCRVCDVGEFVKHECTATRNTMCQPCGKGFTSKGNNSEVCDPVARENGSPTLYHDSLLLNIVVLLSMFWAINILR